MAAVVIDSSAAVQLFTGSYPDPDLRRKAIVENLVAPELIDIEILSVVRRLERMGRLQPDLGARIVHRLAQAPIVRVTHRPLIPRIWQLRHSITAYDAAYIALAEHLKVPLVACDAKLAGSNGHDAKIELYPRG